MLKRYVGDGKPFPPANTRVKVIKGSAYEGQTVYVAGYNAKYPNEERLVVKDVPDSFHGNFVDEWEQESDSVVSGLSPKKQRRLAEEATDVAKSLGYCAESAKVLAALGLPVKKQKTITLDLWDDDVVKVKVNGKTVEAEVK